jgi:hypothetical protein
MISLGIMILCVSSRMRSTRLGHPTKIRRLARNFFLNEDVLSNKNFDMVLIRGMDRHKADMLMQEVHEGSFGTRANGHAMAKKMLRAGYY